MTLELEERISSRCGLCRVVFVFMKILSWNTRGLGSRKKRRIVRRFLSTQNPDVVLLQETKREIWDRRFVSSVWKGKCLDWVALPACGAFGGIVILWDSVKFNLYGPNKAVWRKDFWMELQDLHGLTFPRWCVGGDFNVIRRISEKMGDSRLTVNMRCFDEFIRESGLLDPPLRNAAFTWSNMQVDPICKRFENMWLLHPEFKVKFRDWWQECTVEGWEGDSWKIEGIDWAPISEESAIWLDRPFSEEEVRMAVFQLNKEKAPGPDGFTIAVYQECWDVIKEDLMRVFFEFHTKGVLSGRLRKVLHETIFGSQGAFVEGRQILDAVLIAMKWWMRKEDHVLQRKGFSQKWRSWMRGCLSSSNFAILVNGNAKGWVKASRGLRQGRSSFSFPFYSSSRCSKVSKWPLSYLGLPLGGNPKTIGFWDPVIEKMQRDFLWSGGRGREEDHLIRWEVVSRPREMGGLGFGKTSMRNSALLGKWLWRFPRERSGLWHKDVLGKAIAQVFQEFSPFVRLVSYFCENLTVSNVLGNSLPLSWNFNFRRNLTDSEIDLLQRLMSSLNSVLLSLSSSELKSVVFVFVRLVFSEIFFLCLVKSFKSLNVPSGQVFYGAQKSLQRLFNLVGVIWVPPRSLEDMLVISFKGLGNSLRGKTLWQIACLTLIWMVWQERNNRIFEDKGRTEEMVWDLIRFYSSLWASLY
ncbi:hypothetical protein CK203_065147 [Vitis vinifera]|uniref:Endonuclease/exonuclease/phosphatase domain-containing protein n=1 Tax=Vitis vinifera TaxID=29760 RepID=A0A438G4S3_VITVI|nr:hypothetical protein CK203_065147 [Vitis vinifera]